MKRGDWAYDHSVLLRLSREGVVRTQAVLDAGVSNSAVSYRCRKDGPWQRLLPGVLLLNSGQPTQRQRMVAALVYGGEQALLTGHAALGLRGLEKSASMADILILVPHDHRRQSSGFVTVERTTRMPKHEICQGLSTAPVVRAALDACRRTKDLQQCRAWLTSVIQPGWTTAEELKCELDSGSGRGSGAPRIVLAELAHNAHSVPEIEAQKLYASTGLPAALHNKDIFDKSGHFIARPDVWLDEVAMAWEVDSVRHHMSPGDFEHTLRRREAMQRQGIIVVAHTPRTIRTEPATVIADLRAAYQRAASRPRPAVRLG